MKKIFSLLLVLTFMLVPFSVSASDNYFYSNGAYQIQGHVIGNCQMEEIVGAEEQASNTYYTLSVDINSTIVFETPIDTLYVSGDAKGDDTYYEFADGEKESNGTCTVTYNPAYRNDSAEYYSLDIDPDNEVEYMQAGSTIRFNKAGEYHLSATLGAATAEERISQLTEREYRGDTYYSQPEVIFSVTVTEETTSENIYDSMHYDENIFSVSGITGYDDGRMVMNNNYVAMCSAPVVIEAKTDLDSIGIVKLEKINGEWVEARYFDGYAVNYGDTSKNWLAAEGFENVDVDYYEFTGTEADLSGEAMVVNKGKKLSFSEPGMYMVWANGANGNSTGLTFEIGDSIASYTNSKVLVDGKEIKFEAYNINGNNYFKLRDIAYALTNHGTGGIFFDVKWDGERNMVNLVSSSKYEAVGGELGEGDGQNKQYQRSTNALIKDGVNVNLNAYLINGNNYFKLRDLGKLIGFNVLWDGENNCILIDTTSSYAE